MHGTTLTDVLLIAKNVVELRPNRLVEADPKIEALVREIIGRVADKWTMLVLEALEEHSVVRFTRLGKLVGGSARRC
jgi:DNA-binding HxlR family transcriptional regulator